MKKKLLIFFISFLVIIAGLGVWGYSYFFGADDSLRSQLQQELSEGFFDFGSLDFYDVENGLENDLKGDLEDGLKSDIENNSEDHSLIEDNNSNNPAAQSEEKKVVTVETILNKYQIKFERLEALVVERANSLYRKAYEEYMAEKSQGPLNQALVVRKYLQAANMLEDSMKVALQDILKEMEAELRANQLPTDVVQETETFYMNMIRERRTALMKRLEEAL
ncbi:hypothetical protein CACET_c07000 [Clostridium aceticum]|uniref:Uncharacterized protein n=1 Tax=Clostridium aceticum TaxID=84022 RepID=A0A0D8IEQ7_9CLOT|nr:hypothetical protein [Clostridium aceticum]AKL94210.1 hypothetical protein CACET_c07000 [Clostridium aceticum]KJF28452.1 hypothetical protein TZ02_00525 [Clostridium aceticum]